MFDLLKRLFKFKTKTQDPDPEPDPDPDPSPDPSQNKPSQIHLFMPELTEFNNQAFQEHQKHPTEDFEPQTIIEDEESPAVTITLSPPLTEYNDLLFHIVTPKAPVIDHYPKKTEEKITSKNFTNNIQKSLESQFSQRHNHYPYLLKSNKLNNYHPPTPKPALRENDNHPPTPRSTLGEFEEVTDIFSYSDGRINKRGIPIFKKTPSSTQLKS